jgi:hypothetical protein
VSVREGVGCVEAGDVEVGAVVEGSEVGVGLRAGVEDGVGAMVGAARVAVGENAVAVAVAAVTGVGVKVGSSVGSGSAQPARTTLTAMIVPRTIAFLIARSFWDSLPAFDVPGKWMHKKPWPRSRLRGQGCARTLLML